mgnify:CR=1 FL=1
MCGECSAHVDAASIRLLSMMRCMGRTRSNDMNKMYRNALSIVIAILSVAYLAGCERGQRTDDVSPSSESATAQATSKDKATSEETCGDESAHADEDKFYYSPFVVQLDSEKFDTVSFKDVGLGRESPEPNDALLETISQAFVYEVGNHTDLNYQGEVVYDERILDPANHLYCGERHLYIDVWRSESPKRWGYSLWSGCGESDNFAWQEVEVDEAKVGTLTEEVSPLAESIADRLAEAESSNCFVKQC